MKYPYLPEVRIADAASHLLISAFGRLDSVSYPLDLETLIYDFLCERERVAFDDERDLGEEGGELVLGKMFPYQNKILISAPLKHESVSGRYRFTIAHEIGHWVLHRPLFLALAQQGDLFSGVGAEDLCTTSLNRNVFPGGATVPTEEWQANRFAISLLLSDSVLREEFLSRFGGPVALRAPIPTHSETALRSLSRRVASQPVGSRPALQDVFGLSTEAMAIALEDRGYVVADTPDGWG